MLFLQFCANPSEICKSIQVICICASKRSRYARSENGIVYSTMTYCFGDIRVWIQIILSNFCLVCIFFNILMANISWTVAQTYINHSISLKSAMTTLRCVYVNCTKLQKMHCFGQFEDYNLGRKYGNQTNDPIFFN